MVQSRHRMRIIDHRIYAFTNENLTSFDRLYNFDGADVLTVLGSGDQYFACKLFGAKNVEVFDSNPLSWPFFVLKFYGICILSYEDFYTLFVESSLEDMDILNKVLPYLPYDILSKLSEFLKGHRDLSEKLIYSELIMISSNFTTGRVIPYFDRESYYRLQTILRYSKLPRIFSRNLLDLPPLVNDRTFDILLTSNIYKWLTLSFDEYVEFLSSFKANSVQVNYTWHPNKELIRNAQELGLRVDLVESTDMTEENMVISKI